MTSDTIRQKFLYNIPLLDNGFPLVKLDDIVSYSGDIKIIRLTELWKLELQSFKELLESLTITTSFILLKNDLSIQNDNPILSNAIKCYLESFAYWFKKANLKVAIV